MTDQHNGNTAHHPHTHSYFRRNSGQNLAKRVHQTLLYVVAACAMSIWASEAAAQGSLGVLNVMCIGDSAAVTVANPSGARWMGVTAELEDGTYYDFPAERLGALSAGTSKQYSVPGRHNPVRYMAALWGGKEKASEPWSDRVVNFQGYNMTDKRSETASCRN